MQDRIVLESQHRGAVLHVLLDAPPGNILDIPLLTELNRRLCSKGRSAILKAIILEGAGANFSYGVSIEEHRPETAGRMPHAFHGLCKSLLRLVRILFKDR